MENILALVREVIIWGDYSLLDGPLFETSNVFGVYWSPSESKFRILWGVASLPPPLGFDHGEVFGSFRVFGVQGPSFYLSLILLLPGIYHEFLVHGCEDISIVRCLETVSPLHL